MLTYWATQTSCVEHRRLFHLLRITTQASCTEEARYYLFLLINILAQPPSLLENRNVLFFSWKMDLARSLEGLRDDVHGRSGRYEDPFKQGLRREVFDVTKRRHCVDPARSIFITFHQM
jgi:hypothetical protein